MIFIGPLPPPLGGFSFITGEMAKRLGEGRAVTVLNRSRRSSARRLLVPILYAWDSGLLLARMVHALASRRPGVVYLALSGGKGQWLDLLFLLLARPFAARVYIHHHSFAYVNASQRSTRAVLQAAPGARHIVLCEGMRRALGDRYGLPMNRILVLSNAAFLSPAEGQGGNKPRSARQPITIGFLGNITEQKGIFVFLALIEKAVAAGLDIRAVVAGPLDDSIRPRFLRQAGALPCVEYLGPVYGEAKKGFFERIDVLGFPSHDPNEAEPVTILESLAANVFVVTTDRGCCGALVEDTAAGLLTSSAEFVDRALAVLSDRPSLERSLAAGGPRLLYRAIRQRHATTLDALVAEIGALSAPAP